MAAYPWDVTYNGGALESFGLVVSQGAFYFDALALTTYGFVYGTDSTWIDDDDCYDATWVEMEL